MLDVYRISADKAEVVKINAEVLSAGAIPAYDLNAGWSFPVYSIDIDGNTIFELRASNPKRRRFIPPEFKISGSSKDAVNQAIIERMESLIKLAGFAGRFQIAIRGDTIVTGNEGPVFVVNLAMYFTMDWDPGEPGQGYNGLCCKIPPYITEIGNMSEELRNMAVIMAVQES